MYRLTEMLASRLQPGVCSSIESAVPEGEAPDS